MTLWGIHSTSEVPRCSPRGGRPRARTHVRPPYAWVANLTKGALRLVLGVDRVSLNEVCWMPRVLRQRAEEDSSVCVTYVCREDCIAGAAVRTSHRESQVRASHQAGSFSILEDE